MRDAGDVDELAGDEMVGGDLGADRDQLVRGDAELGELPLRLDLGLGEVAALGLGDVLDLGAADAELDRGIAVLLLRALRDDLAAVDLEHGDGTCSPASVKMRVMPSFCAMTPERMALILQSAFWRRGALESLRA